MPACRPAEAATISERDRVADILRDLDRVRAEALQSAEALRAIEAYQHARLRAAWSGEMAVVERRYA
jgi:hypothetical protein